MYFHYEFCHGYGATIAFIASAPLVVVVARSMDLILASLWHKY